MLKEKLNIRHTKRINEFIRRRRATVIPLDIGVNEGRKRKIKRRRRRRKRKNKNEGKRALTKIDIIRLKNILDKIINDYDNYALDELTGHYLIGYYGIHYKEKYIEKNFNKLIQEFAPDGDIRSDLFSFIEEEDRDWIENERNELGCYTICG